MSSGRAVGEDNEHGAALTLMSGAICVPAAGVTAGPETGRPVQLLLSPEPAGPLLDSFLYVGVWTRCLVNGWSYRLPLWLGPRGGATMGTWTRARLLQVF